MYLKLSGQDALRVRLALPPFQHTFYLLKSNCFTSKGSFCSRKKIVKVLFPGVAACGSCGVLELWCVGVVVCGSCSVWELRCVGVAVFGSCTVRELRCVRVAVCRS